MSKINSKAFITDNFLLNSKEAATLYHDYAKDMPIIDYHNHLLPKQIAENKPIKNITDVWLSGDHYKWRAMRTNGVDENDITGDASSDTKFEKWAETVPYTLRNPLFHWTQLELKRYFDIDQNCNNGRTKVIIDDSEIGIVYQVSKNGRILSTGPGTGNDLTLKINSSLLNPGTNDLSLEKRNNWGDRKFKLLDQLSINMIETPVIEYDSDNNELSTVMQDGLQWYKNDEEIVGATDSKITPDDLTAEYYVTVSSTLCSITSNILIPEELLALPDELIGKLQIYPNPVNNIINVSAVNEIEDIAIYNLFGQQVLRLAVNSRDTSLDISNLKTGAYIVYVSINNSMKNFKIVKK